MKLQDWRDADEREVAELYGAETLRWRERLGWDTSPSWAIVETGRRLGHVPGWIARNAEGAVMGWTYYILHDLTLQIGGLVSRRPSVARELLDAALGGPEASMARALSCFIFPDSEGVASALSRLRFSVRDTLYLAKPLDGPPLPVRQGAPVPRRWRDTDLAPVVRLLAASYEGVPGAACFAPGGRREEWAHYTTQLVHTPACGRFEPSLSFCVAEPGPIDASRIAAGVLTTRLSPETAHIAQVAVDPTHRRRGLAERLMAEVCVAAKVSGAREVTLMVDAGNSAARALYARAGFVERARFLYGRRGARTRIAA